MGDWNNGNSVPQYPILFHRATQGPITWGCLFGNKLLATARARGGGDEGGDIWLSKSLARRISATGVPDVRGLYGTDMFGVN